MIGHAGCREQYGKDQNEQTEQRRRGFKTSELK